MVEVSVDEDVYMEEEGADGGELEGMTPEEEAEAARLVAAELAALEAEGAGGEVELDEVGLVAAGESEAVDIEVGAEAEAAVDVELDDGNEVKAQTTFAAAAANPAATPGRKGTATGKGKGLGKSETFHGLVHQVGEKTGNMLIKSWKVSEKYGQEAMIPKQNNPAGAKLGSKVSFEVLERPDGARPLAVNVQIRGQVDLSSEAKGYPTEIRRQVLYYLSDDNLKTDKFFQDIIAQSEGGWISMSTILGCPRMKQMKATCELVFSAIEGATEVEVRKAPAGQEAIRRAEGRPPPPLVPKGAGKGGPDKPAWVQQGQQGKGGGPCEDLFYAGVVKTQGRQEPYKFFIACDEITQTYGRDAFFLPDAKPSAVGVGSLVVFSVPATSEVGFSPQASFLGQLAPLGNLCKQEERKGGGGGGAAAPQPQLAGKGPAGKGPGVQRAILKKGAAR